VCSTQSCTATWILFFSLSEYVRQFCVRGLDSFFFRMFSEFRFLIVLRRGCYWFLERVWANKRNAIFWETCTCFVFINSLIHLNISCDSFVDCYLLCCNVTFSRVSRE
jgi:hypothetical protein